jgi:hypothetical protein
MSQDTDRSFAGTRYSSMTDEEIIKLADDKKYYSPIIAELVNRLQRKLDADVYYAIQVTNNKISCPVCESVLSVIADELEESYVLKTGD